MGIDIAFFGSSLVSAYWNGAATYYRGIVKELHERGHRVTFYEPDAYDRQAHRDLQDPDWARVVVYPATEESVHLRLGEAASADLVVKASGVGVFDELLEREVLGLAGPRRRVVFWDVDAPATLERVRGNPADPFRALIGRFDLIFTYGGGPPVVQAYERLGARRCIPIYNGVDPATHHPVPREDRFAGDLVFLGNRLPDRERRVEEYFLAAARALPDRTFLLGGNGWDDKPMPPNVRRLGHVYTRDHNALNVSARLVLNLCRDSMAENGYSPATRVFEAAGAGACILTDAWTGIDRFFAPGEEILVAETPEDVVRCVETIAPERAARIGEAARRRVLREHTYAHRALAVERVLGRVEGLGRRETPS